MRTCIIYVYIYILGKLKELLQYLYKQVTEKKNPRIEKILSRFVSDFMHTKFCLLQKFYEKSYNIKLRI